MSDSVKADFYRLVLTAHKASTLNRIPNFDRLPENLVEMFPCLVAPFKRLAQRYVVPVERFSSLQEHIANLFVANACNP